MSKKQKRPTPHLDLYYEAAESGMLPQRPLWIDRFAGLCVMGSWGIIDRQLLDLFKPSESDEAFMRWEGHSVPYWGSGCAHPQQGVFTPLRQTIVLFMAAMKNEL